MIQPRIITGHALPHYAGSRPGLFTALIKLCTRPTSSTYLDRAAEKLMQQFKGVPLARLAQPGKSSERSDSASQGSVIKLNTAGAKSVVQMAVKLGFLTENFFWSWKGHTINIVSKREKRDTSSFLELDFAEKIAYLRFYLEADGAMFLTLGERLLEYPAGISTRDLFDKPFVDDAFRSITRSYLELTSNLGERTRLRQKLFRLEAQSYEPTTRKHKLLPRLIPLQDCGLLDRKMTNQGETFLPLRRDDKVPLKILVRELGNIRTMEQRFARGEYFAIVASTLCDNVIALSLGEHKVLLCKEVAYAYTRLQDTGVAVYPLNAVMDSVCTELLANHAILSSPDQIMAFLQELQRARATDVRFHVDKQGRPAYLILSDNLLKEMGAARHT